MRAMQSSTASGVACRGEQSAAFRFISRHLAKDAAWPFTEASLNASAGNGVAGERLRDVGGEAVPEWVEAALSWVAAKLLREMPLRNYRLAEDAIPQEERARSLAELGSLRDESCALLECYLRQARRVNRLHALKNGDARWFACQA